MKKNYVWSVLLLSFCLCGLLLVSCDDDDDDVLTEVSGPGNGNNGNGGTTDLSRPEAVDLGLSVKWATCNVGASSPEEYGGYYAWGETEEKSYYDWSSYKYCKGSFDTLTKYCTSSRYGTVDNKTVLEPEDDVAHVKWGGSWRMPTEDEIRELTDNCSWTWTSQNGVNGYVVTSNSNGNRIFLPAAGSRWGESVYDRGSDGYYWSASLGEDRGYGTYRFGFCSGDRNWGWGNRDRGFSVRPVTE